MIVRKSKEQIIEQELELAANLVPDPEMSREISLAVQAYTHAARWFESNVAKDHQAKATNARRLAGVFGVLAFMAIGAVLGLTPLKEVIPYLVRVDNMTGRAEIMSTVTGSTDQTVVDDVYWLSNYVRFREGYNFADSDAYFDVVKLMSYGDTFAEYKNFQLSSKGYTEVLGNNRQLRITIHNTTFLKREGGKGTAQVRYTKTVTDRDGVEDRNLRPVTFVVTISFDYKNKVKKAADEQNNPRGFGVLSYSSVQEIGGSNG